MKYLIIANTIIPFLACVQILRAFIISRHMQAHITARSIRYAMTEDKVLYEKTARAYILLVLAVNTIWFMWNLSRIMANWLPFSSSFIATTSIFFSVILFLKAQIILITAKGKTINFLKKIDFL
jgi:hypothetical protein